MSRRLPPQPREWIDRSRTISFEFERERHEGYAGDVVSSALLARGVRVLARSFKYHRPRGVLSMANHDANVMLESDHATNIRGDVTPIEAGARYRAVNTIGGLRHDAARCLAWFGSVLPVGFYYKAFYRPRWTFPYWERLIRRLAGLGRIDRARRGGRKPRTYRHCDVLVVGAGASGLAAALEFADGTLDVVVADEHPHAGGAIDYQHARDAAAQAFRDEALARIAQCANIELMTGAAAGGCYDRFTVPLVTAAGVVQVYTRALLVATGVMEQPAVFHNNDLPGVMLASAAQRLVHRYAVAPGQVCVVLSANAEGYAAAIDLAEAGIRVAALVDMGTPSAADPHVQALLDRGIQIIPNAHVREARAAGGALAAVVVESHDGNVAQELDCDALLMSVGWAPAGSLVHQAGGRFGYDDTVQQIVPASLPAGVAAAGRVNGVFEFDGRVADGRAAANEIRRFLGESAAPDTARPGRASTAHSHPYPLRADPRGRNFVDFDEDLQLHDLEVGIREGFDSIELLKRYSTIGMGPSQGKVSNMNGVRYLAHYAGREVSAIGATTPRPFWHPVPMGTLAGRRLRREWYTPMHAYHLAHGAEMMDTGAWRRPKSYAAGSPRSQVELEYRAVREAVGIIDVSTLGKIELFGADAEPLIEHAYTCGFDKLAQGMTRYIFMVDGSGTLIDDGVAARLGEGHFYLTATSTHAQTVVRLLQLYVDQLKLDVAVIDRTCQLGAMNLAGPFARRVLARVTDMDLNDERFPYLALREGVVAGVPARLMRVGFVGELGYEIHCDASHAAGVWQALLDAGAPEACRPFGVEAQRLLRLEKGHIIIGQDTDGTTNPFEVGLGWGVKLSKPRFHGRHSLGILKEKVQRRLVGFRIEPSADAPDPGTQAPGPVEECHLVLDGGRIAGRVTSVAHSPTLGMIVGLAFVDLALAEAGQVLTIRTTNGTLVRGTVTPPPFYDPDNERQRPATIASLESAA